MNNNESIVINDKYDEDALIAAYQAQRELKNEKKLSSNRERFNTSSSQDTRAQQYYNEAYKEEYDWLCG